MNKNILTVLIVLLIAFTVAFGFYTMSQLDRIDDELISVDLSIIEIRKSIDRQSVALDSVKALADSNAVKIVKLEKQVDDDD